MASMHIRFHDRMRGRAERCARADGLSLPEFIRLAIAERCDRSEARTSAERPGPPADGKGSSA